LCKAMNGRRAGHVASSELPLTLDESTTKRTNRKKQSTIKHTALFFCLVKEHPARREMRVYQPGNFGNEVLGDRTF